MKAGLTADDKDWILAQNEQLKKDLKGAGWSTSDHFVEGLALGGFIVFIWLKYFVHK